MKTKKQRKSLSEMKAQANMKKQEQLENVSAAVNGGERPNHVVAHGK